MRQEGAVAHVPRLLLDWRARGDGGRHRILDGSLVFADVSGFTSLSERLAARGRAGAEEITDVINSCFTRLLTVAYEDGAGLLKFGGDSMLLLVDGDGHEGRACRAAWRMQEELGAIGSPLTSVGPVELRMSIGVSSGPIHLFLAGSIHEELIVGGRVATDAVELETTAGDGEILVGASTASALDPGLLEPAVGGSRLTGAPALPPPRANFSEAATGVDPAAFIPPPLRDHLAAGDLEGEHRIATLAFIKFAGLDALIDSEGPEAAADALHDLVDRVEREAAASGVLVRGSDVDRDGGKLFCVAGAPTASEWDEEKMLRLVRAALDGGGPLSLRAGLNRGRVFTGEIGTPMRRTYAVMGDAVNIAARLMGQASPGLVYAAPTVVERALSLFESRRLPPLTLKGKALPVAAVSLGRMLGPKRSVSERRLPLIGRESEMAVLSAALDSARSGRGRVVELVGEAGLGKSRLLEELRGGAADFGIQAVACEPYNADTPYGAFRDVLRSLLGVDGRHSPAAVSATVAGRLTAAAADLVPWIPLLANVLDVQALPTPEVDQLAPEFRRAKLAEVVATLCARLLPETNFVAFEDVHWMDEASLELLRAIAKEAANHPWLIVATRRPADRGALGADENAQVVEVLPLSTESASALAGAVAGQLSVDPSSLAAMCERAGGNPLFLKELVTAAVESGDQAVPETVEAVITSRIDRLPPRQRTLLRYASVLGSVFSQDILDRCLPAGETAQGGEWRDLEEFVTADAGGYRFTHALFRDVAYESLSFQRRREIHRRAGQAIGELAGDRADDVAELLSLHYSRGDEHELAWRYSRIAGDRARAKAAHREAAQFYSRALGAANSLPELHVTDVAATWEALGDVAETAGDFDQAADAYRHALRLDRRPSSTACLLQKTGVIRERRGAYAHALHWYRFALRCAEGIPDEHERRRRNTEVCLAYAGVCYRMGEFKAMLSWCGTALEAARTLDDAGGMGHAYYLLHLAHLSLGSPERVRYRGLAVPLLEQVGDERKLGNALSNIGIDAFYTGDWNSALEYHRRAREARERAGDVVGVAVSCANIAEVRSDQGHLDEAEELFQRARRIGAATGHRAVHGFATAGLARIAARRGRHRDAEAQLRAAIREFTTIDARLLLQQTRALLAELALVTGRYRAARRRADEVLRELGEDPFPALAALLHRVRGQALLQEGALQAASAALERCVTLSEEHSVHFERALALQALADVAELREDPAAESLRRESRFLLENLGVIAATEREPAPAPALV